MFAREFRGAREHIRALRLVFSNEFGYSAGLARLRLENLDTGILGGEFPESEIRASVNADHLDLMSADHVLREVDEVVTEVRADLALNRRQTQA